MKQKQQLAVLVVLLFVAGTIWYWFFFHVRTAASTGEVSVAENIPFLGVENPELHKDQVERARKTEYKSNGRNIFSPIPPPPPVPIHPKNDSHPQTPPSIEVVIPKVAPLPVKFFGYGTVPNGTARLAFFTAGEDDIYIVREGEILLNRFRILKINNMNLEYEELSSGLRGTAPLEEQGAPPPA
jgi:hypothetical protein